MNILFTFCGHKVKYKADLRLLINAKQKISVLSSKENASSILIYGFQFDSKFLEA